jgi:hypothetical protein
MHILLGGAFPKRHRANCGVIAVIRKVPVLGRHTSLLFTIGIAFYFEIRRRMSTMGML